MPDAKVDAYFSGSTKWPAELAGIRPILLGCGLDEDLKWGKPCYAHEGENIVILQEFNDFLALMFFKGALLRDPDRVLESQGENTRSALRITFRSVDDVERLADTVRRYLAEAVDVAEAGLELPPPPDLALVAELAERLAGDPELAAAFDALTPGRQRGYNLHIADAKQSSTRLSRIEKCVPKILAGKGLQDR